MIRSFRNKKIAAILQGRAPKGFPPDLVRPAQRKLQMLDSAASLEDLRKPYANRLEALTGIRRGQHSIRINDQWRLVFRWDNGADDVEIMDYH